jgi:AraC family transcriptional regulator of adaptative response/methylated-DNA-[protein]-cysteine methyltransferase
MVDVTGDSGSAGSDYARIERVIAYLEGHYREQPTLAALAAQVGLGPHHFQRLFRRWAGVSPKRFVQQLTAAEARRRLEASRPVLQTAFACGLSGAGRLHDLSVAIHAATPGEIARGGAGLTVRWGAHDSPFGRCLVAITDRGVSHLEFLVDVDGDARAILARVRRAWPRAAWREDAAVTGNVVERVFAPVRRGGDPALALHVRGTNFQVRVWQALLRVPPGALTTYGDLAARIGSPRGARAVGRAVGANPVAYLIPCHRVIRRTGALGDYRWGVGRKRTMVEREASAIGKV